MSADTFDPASVAWVLDTPSLEFLLDAIETCDEVVMDFETTGLDEHAVLGGHANEGYPARVALASLTVPQPDDADKLHPTTWVVPLSHPDSPFSGRWREVLRQIGLRIREFKKPLANQNVKFDARWMRATTGVDLSHLIYWDNQISSHSLDENVTARLGPRASMEFGIPGWKDFDFSRPGAAERVALMDLGVYAARDTYWAWRQKNRHRQLMNLVDPEEPQTPDEVELARLGELMTWVAMPSVATLTAIEQRGMALDVPWVKDQLREHQMEAQDLKDVMIKLYPPRLDEDGNDPLDPEDASFAPTSTWFKTWATRAVEAGDLRVAAMTPNGNPQWNRAVLLRQVRSGSGVAEMLLNYRGHAKKAEFLSAWLGYVTPDGIIHPSYNAGRVVTGRLSSDSPNAQQITAVLKPAFVPRPGYYVAELDQSQVEMRVAAFISRCEPMLEAFRLGKDLHKMLARKILQVGEDQLAVREQRGSRFIPEEEVTATQRQGGKSANFGLLFTMGPFGFQQYAETTYGISFTMDEAVLIHRTFYDMWDGIAQWHAKAIARAKATGQVSSPIGRVRRLPHIHDGDERAAMAERQAVNSPVQGFASDILLIGASSIEGTMPGHNAVVGVRLFGTVHDSLLIEVPIDNWEDKTRECMYRMTTGVLAILSKLGCHFDVPLVVEAKVGTRWGLSDIGEIK